MAESRHRAAEQRPSTDPHASPDAELMRRVGLGDERAFEVIHGRHHPAAERLACRVARSGECGEEAAQASFLSVWHDARSYDPGRSDVRTWLFGIVRHRTLDCLRRHARHESRRASDEGVSERIAAPEDTEGEVIERDAARSLHAAVGQLPEEQRRPIQAVYLEGQTEREAADGLQVPRSTLKSRVQAGLDRLRPLLDAR